MAEEKEKESKRKPMPVQISTAVTNTGQIVLFALCEDGSIWYTRPLVEEYGWVQTKKM